MKVFKTFCFVVTMLGHQPLMAAPKIDFASGDQVLTNCRDIYTKGTVIAKVDDGYTVKFPKGSGPIQCPPFRWHNEFVLPFQSVSEYQLQFLGGFKKSLLFKVGESVTFRFETDKRVVANQPTVDIDAQITDISSNGAIQVKLLSTSLEAGATFWQWVGGNYVDLRHKSLQFERDKRAK